MIALMFYQVLQPHRTAVALSGKLDANAEYQPWVVTDGDGAVPGVPARLQKIGHADGYMMMAEINEYLARVRQQPALLLQKDGYLRVFKTELFQQWAMYNHHIHVRHGGRTASGTKTKLSFWEETRDDLLQYAVQYADTPLFARLLEIFCDGWLEAEEGQDHGWIAKLRDEPDHPDVLAFREACRYALPSSPNEPFFGLLTGRMDEAAGQQMRVDGLAAQAAAKHNGTFKGGSDVSKLNKLAQLCCRDVFRKERGAVTDALNKQQAAAMERKLQAKADKAAASQMKLRAEHARAMVEYEKEVPTYAELLALVEQARKRVAGTIGQAQTMAKEAFYTITIGWRYKDGTCTQSSSAGCRLKCKLQSHPGWKMDQHMIEHVLLLLSLVERGKIKKPDAPELPPMSTRAFGSVTLGKRTADAAIRDRDRQAMYDAFMADVTINPQKYSPVVLLPQVDAETLIGRTIEVRYKMTEEKKEDFVFIASKAR